ncbi:MAG: O-antigen ligase family protein [Bacteroidota bacterium]|nr:O-antigen ligase family protein [Bacteroidota bacterium]
MFSKELHSRIYNYLIALLAFAIPLHKKITVLLIAMIVLNWFLEFNFREKYRKVRDSRLRQQNLLFAIVYMLFAIGLLYTDNLYGGSGGWFKMEVKGSLLIFPLLFSTIDYKWLDKAYVQKLFNFFIIGSVVSCLFCAGNALIAYMGDHRFEVFYYKELSMFHYPSYMAMYITFAVAIILFNMMNRWSSYGLNWKIGWLLLLVFYNAFIITLASKAGILSLGLVYGIAITYSLARKRYKLSGIIGLLLITLINLYIFFPYSSNRMTVARAAVEQDKLDKNSTEGSVLRMLIWRSSSGIIKEHFLTGVGTGDVEDALIQKYEEKDIAMAVEQKLNAHNQYLQTWLAIGLPGLLTLLLMLFLPAWQAFRRYNLVYFLFLFIIAFNFIFESMLETQSGVVFYAFFNVFLFVTKDLMGES